MNASGAVLGTERITNESKAIRALLKRWHKQFGVTKANALFCLEPTGHYGYLLVEELMRAGLPTWLAHPLDIKHSIGSTRGKNDGSMPSALPIMPVGTTTKPDCWGLVLCA
ncbi:MAG: transposase [Flavobacteriales bacterium]|nr:transposase [Flavobacteriales bacterium]